MPDKTGIYVHVPFCAQKCPYCDFYSESYNATLAEQYIDAVVADIERYEGVVADTLYFGGGTPSLINPSLIARVIDVATKRFSLCGEVTLEANPNTISKQRISDYKAMGINRLSFGMQSANPHELTALGRKHSIRQVVDAVTNANACGITNISLDVMVGTPFQTRESLAQTLGVAFALPITHISAYLLKIEQGTPYETSPLLKDCADDDLVSDLYEDMVSLCEKNNFAQYEISNFAKDGFHSRHNLKYWQRDDYIGFGAAAHSFHNGERFCYESSITDYITTKTRHFEPTDPLIETIMLSLRLKTGLALNDIPEERRSGVIIEVERLRGLANIINERVVLTPKGMLVSNAIIGRICDASE